MHGGKLHQLNTTQFYYIFEIKMTMRSSSKKIGVFYYKKHRRRKKPVISNIVQLLDCKPATSSQCYSKTVYKHGEIMKFMLQ